MNTTQKTKLHKCSCGAYGIDDNTKEIKWVADLKTLNRITGLNLTESDFNDAQKCCMCDYCINHWGMDLCKCGSGEKTDKCSCGCGLSAQTYKKYEKRALWVF